MSLLIKTEDYKTLTEGEHLGIIPILELTRKGFYSYLARKVLLPEEKNKIYEIYCNSVQGSSKKIKKVTINSQDDAEKLLGRFNIHKKISYGEKILTFDKVIPTMEIIQWPKKTMLFHTSFNTLTKNKYIPGNDEYIVGTLQIPILDHDTPTSVYKYGQGDLGDDGNCICSTSCCCKKECKCKKKCCCNQYDNIISGWKSLFYLSDLETREIYDEDNDRIFLYFHVVYRYS